MQYSKSQCNFKVVIKLYISCLVATKKIMINLAITNSRRGQLKNDIWQLWWRKHGIMSRADSFAHFFHKIYKNNATNE